jgi:methyl halide transferase
MDDWDSRYRKNDTPWCKGRPHPMLNALLDLALPADFRGRVAVPGCGRGWDLRAIADARPGATVIGIDLSKTALGEVAGDIRGHPAIRLVCGDFLDSEWLGNSVETVDFIWEHTCFCAIHPSRRSDYVKAAAIILKPGSVLAGVFFLDLDDKGAGPPWNCPQGELKGHFGGSFELHLCEMAHETFEGRQGEEYAVLMRRHEWESRI